MVKLGIDEISNYLKGAKMCQRREMFAEMHRVQHELVCIYFPGSLPTQGAEAVALNDIEEYFLKYLRDELSRDEAAAGILRSSRYLDDGR